MGSGSSSPMGASAHDQAFNDTEHTRMIMDQLLNYMIKQLSVRDLLHMSKESECKKYILFKANAIYQHFYELRVFPTRDAKGLLTFRRIEDLVHPKGEQEKERQSLCLVVAYFYTRIFQIYGALALTLIDDMNAMTSSGLMSTYQKGMNLRGYTPGYSDETMQPYYGRGGAPELLPSGRKEQSSLKNFEWIRSFLTSDAQTTYGYKTRYAGSGIDNGTVFMKIENFLKDGPQGKQLYEYPPITYQGGTFFIRVGNANHYDKLDVYTQMDGDIIKVKIGKLTFMNIEKKTIVIKKFSTSFYVRRDDAEYIVYQKSQPISPVPIFMSGIFSKIIRYLRDTIKETKEEIYRLEGLTESDRDSDSDSDRWDKERRDRSDSRYSDSRYDDSRYGDSRDSRDRRDSRDSRDSRYGVRRYGTTPRKEDGITSHLKVEKMIDALEVRRPLGHCIARALQLLKTEPFANQPGISQICSVVFDGKSTNRIGLPKSGKPLSDHPGLFALANLFYDTVTIGSPNLTIGRNRVDNQPSTFDEYVAFMRTLSKQYTGEDKVTDWNKKGLSDIKNKRDTDLCKSADEIPLSSDATDRVYDIVKAMFQKQIAHASECFKIISMLFTITYDPRTNKPTMFKLNDNIIREGFPELERVNRKAREILVEYYTSCENQYREGMKIVLTGQQAKIDAVKQAKARDDAMKTQALIEAQTETRRLHAQQAQDRTRKKQRFKEEVEARSTVSRAELAAEQKITKEREARALQEGRAKAQADLAREQGKKQAVVPAPAGQPKPPAGQPKPPAGQPKGPTVQGKKQKVKNGVSYYPPYGSQYFRE